MDDNYPILSLIIPICISLWFDSICSCWLACLFMLHVPVFNPCSFKVPTTVAFFDFIWAMGSSVFGPPRIIKKIMKGGWGLLGFFSCPWESSASNHPSTSLAESSGCSASLKAAASSWPGLGTGDDWGKDSASKLAPWIAVINSRGNQCVSLSICKFTLERILGAGFSRRSKPRTLKSGWWRWLITFCGTKNPTKTRQSCLMMSASTK